MSWEALQYSVAVCRGIKAQDRAVLTAIAYHSKTETPYLAFCSQGRIAEWCGMAKSTAKACLRRLQKAGELEVVNIGGIGRDKEHLATDWRLPGVERWVKLGAKADTSGVRSRPQRGRNPIPGRGQDPIPIKDINRIKIEDEDAASPLSPSSSVEKEGSEQNNAQCNSLPSSESVSQTRSSLNESKTSKRTNTGHAPDVGDGMSPARVREILAAHPGDEETWQQSLHAVPEFEGKDIEHATNRYMSYCNNMNHPQTREGLLTIIRREHRKVRLSHKANRKLSAFNWQALELLREQWRKGSRTEESVERACQALEVPAEFVFSDRPPAGLKPHVSEWDKRQFADWQAKAMRSRQPAAQPKPPEQQVPESRWTGEADAEAFAAEMAPQLAAAGM